MRKTQRTHPLNQTGTVRLLVTLSDRRHSAGEEDHFVTVTGRTVCWDDEANDARLWIRYGDKALEGLTVTAQAGGHTTDLYAREVTTRQATDVEDAERALKVHRAIRRHREKVDREMQARFGITSFGGTFPEWFTTVCGALGIVTVGVQGCSRYCDGVQWMAPSSAAQTIEHRVGWAFRDQGQAVSA